MRIKRHQVIFGILALFLVIFFIYPATIATRVYAWFNYMDDNIKEVVDLTSRYSTLRTGPYSYRLVYNIDRDMTIVEDLDLKFAKMGAQFMGEYYISDAAHKEGIERIVGVGILLYVFLLPIAAVLMYRKRKLNYLNPSDSLNIPDDKFEIWRGYMNKSINSFFLTVWGTFILSVVIGITIAPFFIQPSSPGIALFVLFSAIMIWFLLGMIDWLRYRVRAVALQKRNKRKFSGLAVVSLICSFVGLAWWIIPTVIGFTLGLVSLGIIKHSHGETRGKGMAMAAFIICTLNTIWSVFLVMHNIGQLCD